MLPLRASCLTAVWLVVGVQAGLAMGAESVRFRSADDTVIEALVFQPSSAPQGTVIALHGCGGLYATGGSRAGSLSARHQAMADRLVNAGYAVVFPDSLTPRGVPELCTQKTRDRRITQRERRGDALATLDWVTQQPWAKVDKVALLGWSHGGSAVLAATDANDAAVERNPLRFNVAIAFYPGCAAALKSNYQPLAPLHLLVGANDDWTPPGPCVTLGQKTGSQVTVFPDSYHGFDNPTGTVVLRRDVPNGVNPGQGVHVGANPAAREAANAQVLRALRDAFSK